MAWMLIRLVLDSGGQGLAKLLSGVVVVALLAVLLAVSAPVALIAGIIGVVPHAPSPAPAGAPTAVARPPAPTGSTPVEIARRYLGVPYVFGGADPATGLDCSGLVQLVFRQLGITLPHNAQLQYDATARVPRDQLQPGDLVFFVRTYADAHDWITHVGIYIGGGMQINAPTDGQVVSIQPVFSGFWGDHFTGGGRVRSA